MEEKFELTRTRKILLFGVLPFLLIVLVVIAFLKKNPSQQDKGISATFEASTKADTSSTSKTELYNKEHQDKKQEENNRILSTQSFYSVNESKTETAPVQQQPAVTQPVIEQRTIRPNNSQARQAATAIYSVPRGGRVVQQQSVRVVEVPDQVTGMDDDPEIIELKQIQARQRAAGLKVTPIPASLIEKKRLLAQLKKQYSAGNTKSQDEVVQNKTVQYSSIPGKRTRGGNTISSRGDLIPAVIHEDQTIINGSRVKLRLMKDISINGTNVPRNTFITGIATFNKSRASITLTSLIINGSVLDFNKKVYDKDGLEGLSLPENEKATDARDLSSDAVTNAANTAAIASSGVAGAMISTAKSFVTRKAGQKTQKLHLKANYQIYLR